jgi:hypothetical protein
MAPTQFMLQIAVVDAEENLLTNVIQDRSIIAAFHQRLHQRLGSFG